MSCYIFIVSKMFKHGSENILLKFYLNPQEKKIVFEIQEI